MVKRTHFGIAALASAVVSILFLAAYFAIAVMDITPATFFKLNNLTALVYCLSTPIALVLGMISITRKNDSISLGWSAMGLVGVPFLVIFWQFLSFLRGL